MSAESNNFKSKEIVLRAQKKILSQFSTRKAAKVFISESLSNLLDLLYQLVKTHTNDKKHAEKFVKNLIKLSVKIGLLSQNEQFSPEETTIANSFAEKFRTVAMTIVSFVEVDFSYDQKFLLSAVDQCEEQIKSLIKNHLTDKSVARVDQVATQLRDTSLLDSAFEKGSPQNAIMIKIADEINKAIDSGDI